MSKTSRAGRHLDPHRVQLALQVQQKKHELAMQMVADRVKHDAEFAADVIKIGGEFLREDIKKSAEETVLKSRQEKFEATELVECGCQRCGCHDDELTEPDTVQPAEIRKAIETHCQTSVDQTKDLIKQLEDAGKEVPSALKSAVEGK